MLWLLLIAAVCAAHSAIADEPPPQPTVVPADSTPIPASTVPIPEEIRDTYGYDWLAWKRDAIDELRITRTRLQQFRHTKSECEVYARQYNENRPSIKNPINFDELKCVRGQFQKRPELDNTLGYVCPHKRGNLFVAARDTSGSAVHVRDMAHHYQFPLIYDLRANITIDGRRPFSNHWRKNDNKSYPLVVNDDDILYIGVTDAEDHVNICEYADHNVRPWKCEHLRYAVTGFYCIERVHKPVPYVPPLNYSLGYPVDTPSDLRVPAEEQADFFIVDSCYSCFEDQICDARSDGKYQCYCRPNHESIYPDPEAETKSQVKCRSTYFKVYTWKYLREPVLVTVRPKISMTHASELCEEYARTNEGTYNCFAGEFSRHPRYEGIYTCDFGESSGSLLMRTRPPADGDEIVKDAALLSNHNYTGVKSFVIAYEEVKYEYGWSTHHSPAFYAYGDSILMRMNNNELVGFYCIIRQT